MAASVVASIALPISNNFSFAPSMDAYGKLSEYGKLGAWSPLSLFAASEVGAWYDPSDLSTMFQDSAGTTPVTADGQPVGLILDKSGRGNHASQATAASRPVLQQDGNGKYYLAFDGVDDWLRAANIPFAGLTKLTTFHGVVNNSATGWLVLFLSSSGSFAVPGAFGEQMPTSGANGASLAYGSGDSTFVQATHTGTINGAAYTKTALYDLTVATRTLVTRINGVENATANRSIIGTLLSFPLTVFANNAGSEVAQGRLYSLIILGRLATAQEIADTEAWVNSKTGAY